MAEDRVESTAAVQPEASGSQPTTAPKPEPKVEGTAKSGSGDEKDVSQTQKPQESDLEKKGMDYWTSQAQKNERRAETAEYEKDKLSAKFQKLEERLDKAGMGTKEDNPSIDEERATLEREKAVVKIQKAILSDISKSDLDDRTKNLLLANPFAAVDPEVLERAVDDDHAVDLTIKAIRSEYLTPKTSPDVPAPDQQTPKVVGNNPVDQSNLNVSSVDKFPSLSKEEQKADLEQTGEQVYGEKPKI